MGCTGNGFFAKNPTKKPVYVPTVKLLTCHVRGCRYQCKTASQPEAHIRKAHSKKPTPTPTPQKKYVCEKCGEVFPTQKKLNINKNWCGRKPKPNDGKHPYRPGCTCTDCYHSPEETQRIDNLISDNAAFIRKQQAFMASLTGGRRPGIRPHSRIEKNRRTGK